MPAERRRGERAAVDFFVEERRGDRTWLHPATDLSADGLYILVEDDRIAIDGSRAFAIEFTLPTGALIQADVHIAYTDDRAGQRGVGLHFVDLAADTRAAISAYVTASAHARARTRRLA